MLVNRIWLHHFGRGLVDTPGDFGKLGHRPTHPELLDWLADELVRGGWSLKRSAPADHDLDGLPSIVAAAIRPRTPWTATTRLLGRYPVRRLDAESVRDTILRDSGRLDETQYGPPVPVVEDSVGLVNPANNSARRSLYLQVRRTRPVSLLAAFDAPVMTLNCDRRNVTTTPGTVTHAHE